MASEEEIKAQQELLSAYRRTLFELLRQRALITASFIPPAMANGIQDARDQIRRIKKSLRDWEVSIDDHPNDEEFSSLPPEPLGGVQRGQANTTRVGYIGWSIGALVLLASVAIVSLVLFFTARNSTKTIFPTATVAVSLAELPTAISPTVIPTAVPIAVPTVVPPTAVPIAVPTVVPPTAMPTAVPTAVPTVVPPTVPPTFTPTNTPMPPPPAQWQDISASALGNPRPGDDDEDVAALFRAVDGYAVNNNFGRAFPNLQVSNGKFGVVILREEVVNWQDVPVANLGNPPPGDVAALFRAVDGYAVNNHLGRAFPTFQFSKGKYGVVILREEVVNWQDVPVADLGNPPPGNVGALLRAVDSYAVNNHLGRAFPTFQFSNGKYGVVFIRSSN